MEALAIALISFLFVSGVVAAQLAFQIRLGKTWATLELRPNCLLTRYPIVFVSGRRSLFYFIHYWNRVPRFLTEHGYQVTEISLPWRNSSRRLETLLARLNEHSGPLHLIADSSSSDDVLLIKEALPDQIASAHTSDQFIANLPEVNPSPNKFELSTLLRRALFSIHHKAVRIGPVSPEQMGIPRTSLDWSVEEAFLRHSITLAEREMETA